MIHATSSQVHIHIFARCVFTMSPQIQNSGTPFIPKGLLKLISGKMKRVPFMKKDSFSFWASANPAVCIIYACRNASSASMKCLQASACMRKHAHAYACECICIYMHMHMHAYAYAYAYDMHMHKKCICICMCMCMCMCMCTCIRMHACIALFWKKGHKTR